MMSPEEKDPNPGPPENNELVPYSGIARYLPLLWAGILISGLILVLMVYRTYAWPAFFALIIFVAVKPVNDRLIKKISFAPSLAALLSTMVAMFGIILPVFLVVQALVSETIDFVEALNEFLTDEKIFELVTEYPLLLKYFTSDDFWWADIHIKYSHILGDYANYLEWKNISTVIQNAGNVILGSLSLPMVFVSKFLLMIVILFFLLKDGRAFANFFYEAMPFPDWMEKRVVDKFTTVVGAVLKGNLLVAITQGVFVWLGFLIAGIPSPILWGAMGAAVAIIPIIGTGIVFIPGALYLILFQGELGWGIFLFTFCMTSYQGLDLLMKPALLDKKLGLHPLFLFLSILGGLAEFGLPGLIIGPLSVTIFMTIYEIARNSSLETYQEH